MEHPSRILSIQSHAVHGYVGNKAAVFPLQCLGADVDIINTIVLSNHPAYSGGFQGHALQPNELECLVTGLQNNNLANYDAILTGYVRSRPVLEAIADAVESIRTSATRETSAEETSKSSRPCYYFLDPVLGDNGRYYVPEELNEVYLDRLLKFATVSLIMALEFSPCFFYNCHNIFTFILLIHRWLLLTNLRRRCYLAFKFQPCRMLFAAANGSILKAPESWC